MKIDKYCLKIFWRLRGEKVVGEIVDFEGIWF